MLSFLRRFTLWRLTKQNDVSGCLSCLRRFHSYLKNGTAGTCGRWSLKPVCVMLYNHNCIPKYHNIKYSDSQTVAISGLLQSARMKILH